MQGLQALGRGMAVSQARELTLWCPSFSAARGHGHTLAGDARSGVMHCQAAIDQAAKAGIVAGDSLRKAWLGRALLSAGRLEIAREVTAAALGAVSQSLERGGQAWLLKLLGDIDLQDERERYSAA